MRLAFCLLLLMLWGVLGWIGLCRVVVVLGRRPERTARKLRQLPRRGQNVRRVTMAMKRVLPEPEGYRAQVRQIVYARVRKAGWEYPPGMDLKIMQHWGRAESAQLAAKSLCAEYFPSENAEFEKLPLCLVCQGDGSGLTPGGKKTRTSWCDGCGGTGRVR